VGPWVEKNIVCEMGGVASGKGQEGKNVKKKKVKSEKQAE
jgi:hypothetical protein